MSAQSTTGTGTSATSEREFVISRTFDAPRELVFQSHADCEHLVHWWGPKGFILFACENDFRPGGAFHYGLRAPNGDEMWGKLTYREIVPPERLVAVVSFSDAGGNLTRHPYAPDWPRQTLSTATFDAQDGRTIITIRWAPLSPTEAERRTFDASHDSMRQGWTGTMDQLAEYLATLCADGSEHGL